MSGGGRRAEVMLSSQLDEAPDAVWARVTSPEGVNHELRPLMRMTVPEGLEDGIVPDRVTLGEPLGRSWVLLFGLVPFDYDDITLVALEPGRRFLERSRMLTQRVWEHERTVEPGDDGGSVVTDRVAWELRLPLPGRLARPMVRSVFRHRHARLRSHHGGRPLTG